MEKYIEQTYDNGDCYKGETDGSVRSGKGEYIWKNGQRYVGEFRDNKINGTGTVYFINGNVYTGEWKDEAMSGKGEYTWKNGQRYVGEFRDNKINGTGTMYFVDGNVYSGEWKDEKMSGKGELCLANSSRPPVPFDNGRYDLRERYVGKWENGKLSGEVYHWFGGIPYPRWFEDDRDKGSYLDIAAAERQVTDTSVRGKFLGQSGFWLQLPEVTLIFDCYMGELPPTRRDVPVVVFISHIHMDHFNECIFQLIKSFERISFVIGADDSSEATVTNNIDHFDKKIPGLDDRTFIIRGGRSLDLGSIGVTVQSLFSTDMGVAFIVKTGGKTFFHAGDLWIMDDTGIGLAEFRRYASPLTGLHIDLAMLPLDPRFGNNGLESTAHYLSIADIDTFIPMHLWENYRFINTFIKAYPKEAKRMIMPVLKDKNIPSAGVLRCTDDKGHFSL